MKTFFGFPDYQLYPHNKASAADAKQQAQIMINSRAKRLSVCATRSCSRANYQPTDCHRRTTIKFYEHYLQF